MAVKGNAEADFFWACAAQAMKSNGPKRSHPRNANELFGKQLTAGINFEQYDHIPVSRKCEGPTVKACGVIPCLADFGALADRLPRFLFENVKRMGYVVPTPIQKHAVPLAVDGRADLMCCAQTGSGKTCAFLLPAIALIANGDSTTPAPPPPLGKPVLSQWETPARPRVLVLAPTRELAIQIQVEATKLLYGSPFFASVVYGGASARQQLEELACGVDVLVATPGRLNDFLERGLVTLRYCAVLVR
jgi:ATP-dependent RNA helicase DDX3X